MGNPGKGHLGIFILFLQLFCKSQKKILKGETSPKNSSLGHFYTQKIWIASKTKCLGENLVEDGQNLWGKFKT